MQWTADNVTIISKVMYQLSVIDPSTRGELPSTSELESSLNIGLCCPALSTNVELCHVGSYVGQIIVIFSVRHHVTSSC